MSNGGPAADENGSSGGGVRPTTEDGILVAIVNYCTADVTIDCLRSLESEVAANPGTLVIVADNASPDGSGRAIADAIEKNRWGDWARLLPLPRNGGFAYGNNGAIREYLRIAGRPKYVWLLNSDTLARPDALTTLLSFMDTHPQVGIAGSCLEHHDGTQQCSVFRFHSVLGELEGSVNVGLLTRLLKRHVVASPPVRESMSCDWVSGASMMIRMDVIEQIGLMDEAYFLYYEETDFCLKSHKKGWACWFVPESRVVHLIGKSTGVTGSGNPTRRRSHYWFVSRRRYFEKNHGSLYAIMADAAVVAGGLLNRALNMTRIRPAVLPEFFIRDLMHHSAIWPSRSEQRQDR